MPPMPLRIGIPSTEATRKLILAQKALTDTCKIMFRDLGGGCATCETMFRVLGGGCASCETMSGDLGDGCASCETMFRDLGENFRH